MAELREWRVLIPKPTIWLTSNNEATTSRAQRYARAEKVRAWRRVTVEELRRKGFPTGVTPVSLYLKFFFAGHRPVRDRLNLSPTVKAIVDGLCPSPVVKFVHIEPVLDDAAAETVRALFQAAFKARTGHRPDDVDEAAPRRGGRMAGEQPLPFEHVKDYEDGEPPAGDHEATTTEDDWADDDQADEGDPADPDGSDQDDDPDAASETSGATVTNLFSDGDQ